MALKFFLSTVLTYWIRDPMDHTKILMHRASLVVQWLRLHTPNAGDPGLIPVWGTRSHVPQLRPSAAK